MCGIYLDSRIISRDGCCGAVRLERRARCARRGPFIPSPSDLGSPRAPRRSPAAGLGAAPAAPRCTRSTGSAAAARATAPRPAAPGTAAAARSARLGSGIIPTPLPAVAHQLPTVLIASKVVSQESLRRWICWVDFLYIISIIKERSFFFPRLTMEQKFEARKNVVLQFLGGKSVARIKSCVPCSIRTIYRWISRFLLGGMENLRDRQRTGRPRQGTDRRVA